MKIMLLGYTTSGKTYFLGSLFRLSFEVGRGGFSIQPQNFTELGEIQKIYDAVKNNKQIPLTARLVDAPLILRHGLNHAFDVSITDIEGQAIRPGGKIEVANKIQSIAADYDAFIIFVKAPVDEKEQQIALQELAQSLNFISEVFKTNKKSVPIVLVLNKIDLLPNAKGLKDKITQTKESLIASCSLDDPMSILQIIETELGTAIAPLVKPITRSLYIYSVINQFFRHLQEYDIPNKVFIGTNHGFDNDANDELNPYGTGAAFLWAVYANLMYKQQQEGLKGNRNEYTDKLLLDIKNHFVGGKAYFDDSGNGKYAIWNSDNIDHLYSNKLWEQ